MRDYGKVSPTFWVGKTGREISRRGSEGVIVALYLMSSPSSNMLGIYYQPLLYMAHETGLGIDGASKGLRDCIEAGFCAYDEDTETVFVYEMAKYQIAASLLASDKRCKGIQKDFDALESGPFVDNFFDRYREAFHLKRKSESGKIEAPSKPLPSQEQEQEQEQELTTLSGKPDPGFSLEPPDPKPSAKKPNLKPQALEILDFLNAKAGRNYRPVDANIEFITARLREGASVAECRQVIARKCREWLADEKMSGFLRPATIFNRTNFAQYAGELGGDQP